MPTPTFVAPTSTGNSKKLTPGVYIARCYQMIMLGTQTEDYLGEEKTAKKIWLGWEFPTELDTFSAEKGEQPYTMGKEFTYSMHEKATYRQTLEAWRGKKFNEEEARTFDAGKLLGAVCQINVQEYAKRNGEMGVKIGGIMPVTKGTVVPAAINPIQALSLQPDQFDYGLFNDLPKFLRDRILQSPEYAIIDGPKDPVYQPKQDPTEALFGKEEVEEELPF